MLAVLSLLGLSACGAAPGNADSGLRAYRDSVTGELRAPTAAERSALPQASAARTTTDSRPERIDLPDGGVGLRYRARSGLCASVAADGRIQQHDCPAGTR